MALADPQSITYDGAKSLPRTQSGPLESVYTDVANGLEFVVSHNFGKRSRTAIRLNLEKIAADPLTSVNQQVSSSAYIVIDRPISGFSVTELKDLVLALGTWTSASSAANLIKVLQEEH